MLVVSSVLVACDSVECGYRIIRLLGGRFAFVWGNIRARVGGVLPSAWVEQPLAERGIEVFDSYPEAEQAYRRCALALQQTSSLAGAEMLARLGE